MLHKEVKLYSRLTGKDGYKTSISVIGAYLDGYEKGKADAQPEQRWIPCNERLPEVKQKVLVQYADGSMATKRCNDAGHLQWFYANAVAWMPAPEPYHEDCGETNESD